MDNNNHQDIKKTSFWKNPGRLLIHISGARPHLLSKSPAEQNKYLGIGALLVMSGLFAGLSGGYAMYFVFSNIPAAIILGMVWAVMIFWLNWFFITSLKKEKKFYRELINALPRLLLAILIGMVISHPLELKLFESEIAEQGIQTRTEKALGFQDNVNQQYQAIARLEEQNQELKQEIRAKEKLRDQLYREVVREVEGLSPTQQKGRGPVYEEKNARLNTIKQELKNLRQKNQAQIENNLKRINELEEQKQARLTSYKEIQEGSLGLLGRLNAMATIAANNPSAKRAIWLVTLLFILIEATPVIIKLMAHYGPYDQHIELLEEQAYAQTRESLYQLKTKEINKINDSTENLEKHKQNMTENLTTEYLKQIRQ